MMTTQFMFKWINIFRWNFYSETSPLVAIMKKWKVTLLVDWIWMFMILLKRLPDDNIWVWGGNQDVIQTQWEVEESREGFRKWEDVENKGREKQRTNHHKPCVVCVCVLWVKVWTTLSQASHLALTFSDWTHSAAQPTVPFTFLILSWGESWMCWLAEATLLWLGFRKNDALRGTLALTMLHTSQL